MSREKRTMMSERPVKRKRTDRAVEKVATRQSREGFRGNVAISGVYHGGRASGEGSKGYAEARKVVSEEWQAPRPPLHAVRGSQRGRRRRTTGSRRSRPPRFMQPVLLRSERIHCPSL